MTTLRQDESSPIAPGVVLSSHGAAALAPAKALRTGRWILTVLFVAAFIAILYASFHRQELPVLGMIPAFRLTDEEGMPFDSEQLRGKAWIATFLFTSCSDTCPRMSGKLALVQGAVKAVPGLADRVRLISFSVDPIRDEPRKMRQYIEGYGADRTLWRFLLGPEAEVGRLCTQSFLLPLGRAALEDGSPAGEIVHSDRFCLVDGAGRLRGLYRPIAEDGQQEIERLLRDMKQLAAETPP